MKAASCFSGIGAPELGGPQFDWVWCAEVEKFPSAVLAKRFPQSVNLGDVTADDFLQRASAFGPLDLLVGGPPCQDFSVAGLRAGVAGDRGNLSLRFMEIAHAIRPRNLLVENVPGWLNMPDNAFGCFLGALVGADDALRSPLDGKWPSAGMVAGPRARAAWRVLDAQYFGVAQRRRRVFVVADFGDGADPCSVLFERASVRGNFAPRREAGQGTAGTISARTQGGGGLGTDFELGGGLVHCHDVAPTLNTHLGDKQGLEDQHINGGCGHFIAHSLRREGFDASEDGTGRGTPIIPIDMRQASRGATMTNNRAEGSSGGAPGTGIGEPGDPSPTISTSHPPAIAFTTEQTPKSNVDCALTLTKQSPTGGGQIQSVAVPVAYGISRDALDRSGEGASGSAGERAGLGIVDDASPTLKAKGPNAVAFAQNQRDELRTMDVAGALAAEPGMKQTTYVMTEPAVAFQERGRTDGRNVEWQDDLAYSLNAPNGGGRRQELNIATAWQVRRLTPTECERLQSFPDGFTDIEYRGKRAADGPRYKALGNSWAASNGAWIIARIAERLAA